MRIFLYSMGDVPLEKLQVLAEKLPPDRAIDKDAPAERLSARVIGYFLVSYAAKQLDPAADTSQWIIEEGGKPHLPHDTVHFSLSHTDTLVAVAVSKSHPVGVDIEEIRPRRAGFAARWFTAAEQAWIAAAEDKDAALTLLWTKKEAVAKKSGTGLGFDLSHIDVAHSASCTFEASGKRYALSLSPAEKLPTLEWVRFSDFVP